MPKWMKLFVVLPLIGCISCEDVFDDKKKADGGLPFSWGEVSWCTESDPIGDWEATVEIESVSLGQSTVSWSYTTPPGDWKTTGSINKNPNACLGFVTQIGGNWYAAIGEWLPKGATGQATKAFQSSREGGNVFSGGLANYSPSSGDVLYIFVCGLNWVGQRNVQERSNLVEATFP